MGKFSDSLRKSIRISGIKYSTISSRINFDQSYISKWINANLLPAYKSSSFICSELADIFLENLSDSDLIIFCEQMEIEYPEDRKDIRTKLYNRLYSDYLYDYKLKNTKDKSSYKSNYEMKTYSSFQEISNSQDIILKKLLEYRSLSDSIEIFIVADIFSCSDEDLIFLMDLKKEIDLLNFKDVVFKFFISEPNMIESTNTEASMSFLNLLMLEFNAEISYYRNEITQSGLIISIENLLLYSAQLLHNKVWTFSHFTYHVQEINHFNKMIKKSLLPVGIKLFEIYESTCPKHISYMQYILSNDEDSVLIGSLDTSFLTTEILEELFKLVKDLTPDIKNCWIKKHLINQDRVLKGESFRYIVFKEAFKKLVKKGRMRLIGEEIVIPVELRVKVLECMKKTLSDFPNVEFKIIDKRLASGVKHKHLPNLYLASTSGFFLMFPVYGHSKFCHIRDEVYSASLRKTFDRIWEEESLATSSSAETIDKYLDICREMFLFEQI